MFLQIYMYTQPFSHINISTYTYIPTYLPTCLPILLHAECLHLCASQVEAAQSRRLLSLEETVMLRDRKISELQAQVAERQWPWREAKRWTPNKSPKTTGLFLAPDFFSFWGFGGGIADLRLEICRQVYIKCFFFGEWECDKKSRCQFGDLSLLLGGWGEVEHSFAVLQYAYQAEAILEKHGKFSAVSILLLIPWDPWDWYIYLHVP